MLFVAELIFNIECQQHAAGNTDGKSENVDKGEYFMLEQIPESNGDVIFEHTGTDCDQLFSNINAIKKTVNATSIKGFLKKGRPVMDDGVRMRSYWVLLLATGFWPLANGWE
jgi:hypothetical protein